MDGKAALGVLCTGFPCSRGTQELMQELTGAVGIAAVTWNATAQVCALTGSGLDRNCKIRYAVARVCGVDRTPQTCAVAYQVTVAIPINRFS